MKTKFIFSLVMICSSLSWSYPSNLNQMKEKAQYLFQLLNGREGMALSDYEGMQIERNLDQAIENLRSPGGNHPNPPSYPPPNSHPTPRNFVKAECHIDDDPQLDFNQKIEVLESFSLQQLIADCRELARMSYGQNGSAGIKNVQIMTNYMPPYMQTAICEIDDDPQFDAGQITIGTLAGLSISEIISDCRAIAQMAYRGNGSMGLKQLNVNRNAPRGMKSAECWLDDDPQFDAGQLLAGKVWGQSISELGQQCSELARVTYGGRGSSGLQNISN